MEHEQARVIKVKTNPQQHLQVTLHMIYGQTLNVHKLQYTLWSSLCMVNIEHRENRTWARLLN